MTYIINYYRVVDDRGLIIREFYTDVFNRIICQYNPTTVLEASVYDKIMIGYTAAISDAGFKVKYYVTELEEGLITQSDKYLL